MTVRTFRKLHRDVSGCTSGHNGYYVGTYQMLHRDVSDATSGRNFFFTVAMRGNKVAIKKLLLPRVISL
ncbi:hypothetical protein ONT17_14430 [Prevotella copri]|uniref:hypothetical protein n=1 Tax=Segatella copri TaxID=165179 RepID=UPI002231F778|nr:hypothetical protein [Segatella copri]MCW4119925.1 hypothetical protein [Segatella copri]